MAAEYRVGEQPDSRPRSAQDNQQGDKSKINEDDEPQSWWLTFEQFSHQPLNHEAGEQRFLVLQPSSLGGALSEDNHVRCNMEVVPLDDAKPFIAIKNTRGYRLFKHAIEINAKVLGVPVALERFLRNFRRRDAPIRLWARHICLTESIKEEQTRYWNRQFVDSMYARATGVIDMATFLDEKLQEGQLKQEVRRDFATWEKVWHGTEGEMTLPKVFPIRLGKKPSNETPADHHDYVPLDQVVNEIRLLCVVPSLDPEAPVVTHLAHCPMVCEVGYYCLSYTWGDRENTAEIVVNGQRMRVRKHLEQALKALRQPSLIFAIWIDAICIDQLNPLEKNRQIPQIGRIYDRGRAVVCYIGPSDLDSDRGLEFANQLQGPMMRFNEQGDWDIGNKEKIPADQHPRLCAALYKILTRPYFRRVWILQEVASASNPIVACGSNRETLMENLETAAYNLQDMMARDPALADKMRMADSSLIEVSEEKLVFVRKMFYFRHLKCKGEHPRAMPMRVTKIKDTAPGFLETAILTRDFQATDGRDKIFALWNLANDKDGLEFEIGYSKSVADSFTEFVKAWAWQQGSLDIIAAAEPSPESKAFYSEAPSWCPDWTVPSTSSCLIRRERIPSQLMAFVDDLDGRLYAADGGVGGAVSDISLFHFDGNILSCTGFILDRISTIFDEPPEPPDGTQFLSQDPHTFFKYYHWGAEIKRFYGEKSLDTYDDPLQAAIAMFHGDGCSAWPFRDENPDMVDENYSEELYVCKPELSRHIKKFGRTYCRIEARGTIKMMVRGRALCVTEQGYMALVPSWVRDNPTGKPWLLSILAGCSVPVLLQENDDGSYRVFGSCFVQGWMDGEMITAKMATADPKDFWAARKENAKLRLI